MPATWEKQHHCIGLSRVVLRPRYHKGEDRIAMTHYESSVVSSRDERRGNQCGRLLGLKAEGFLQCHSTERATYPVKEGRRRGRLGSLTLDMTDEQSRQDQPRVLHGGQPVVQPRARGTHSTRLTASPAQKGVPVPTSYINQPEGRSMRVSSDRFYWEKRQSLHRAEQWTSGFANVARILTSTRQEETAGSTTRAEGSGTLNLYTSPQSPRQVGVPWKLPITSVRAPHGGQPLGTYK